MPSDQSRNGRRVGIGIPDVAFRGSAEDDPVGPWEHVARTAAQGVAHFGLRKQDGELACRTRRSTGDKDIDAIRCDAMLTCMAPIEGQIDAVASSDLPTAERNRRISELSMSATPCMDDYHDRAVARLAAQRAAQ